MSPSRGRTTERPAPDDAAATLRDGGHVQRCYELAEVAVREGNHPFGALLVQRNEVIAEARNAVVTQIDVTRHAELRLVSEAWSRFGPETLAECTLYASTEPCLMCAGAIHWAGIRRVVYGVAASALARILGRPDAGLALRALVERAGLEIAVIGPVMQSDGLRTHAEFWPAQGHGAPPLDGPG